ASDPGSGYATTFPVPARRRSGFEPVARSCCNRFPKIRGRALRCRGRRSAVYTGPAGGVCSGRRVGQRNDGDSFFVYSRGMEKQLVCAALLFAGVVLTTASCDYDRAETGPTREVPVSIDKGNVDHANIELDMGAGELAINGGASKLVDGKFEFNAPSGEPRVRSSITATHATITSE